jgi:hypothetical protein
MPQKIQISIKGVIMRRPKSETCIKCKKVPAGEFCTDRCLPKTKGRTPKYITKETGVFTEIGLQTGWEIK